MTDTATTAGAIHHDAAADRPVGRGDQAAAQQEGPQSRRSHRAPDHAVPLPAGGRRGVGPSRSGATRYPAGARPCLPTDRPIEEPVVKVPLHSTDDASRRSALLVGRIFPIFSLLVPGSPGASPVSMRRATFTTGS